MVGKQEGKPLSFKAVEMMKPGDKDKADVGENRGLRVSCGAAGVKSFFYRYTSPLTGKLAQVKISNFPRLLSLLHVLNSTNYGLTPPR